MCIYLNCVKVSGTERTMLEFSGGLRENCLKEWAGKNTSSGNLGKKGSTKFQRGAEILKSPEKQLETCKST